MGNIANSVKPCINIASHLILEGFSDDMEPQKRETAEIVRCLKEFWTHKGLGLQDPVDAQNKEAALDRTRQSTAAEPIAKVTGMTDFNITFDGQRYEVSLPWKQDLLNSEHLLDNFQLCVKRLN